MTKTLFLIFHGRFPSDKAASLFAAKSAEAFAEEGIRVTLLVPKRHGALPNDPYQYYDAKKNFDIVFLPTLDIFGPKYLDTLAFWLSYLSFSISVFFHIRKASGTDDILYSNELLPLTLASYIRPNSFYEMHDFPESKKTLFGKMLERMRWILVHNKWKLEETKRLFPEISSSKFIYEPNAVDIGVFDIPISKEEARKNLSLLQSGTLAVYTGHLYSWKGVDTLAEAAELLPPEFRVVFVGGTSEDVENFSKKYGASKHISIMGHVPHGEIPLWQKAADVLVLPNTAKEKISALYTSPMKLFEYMASGRVIVATDIPSLREILGEKNSIIAAPDDAPSLAKALREAVGDRRAAEKLATQALHDVGEYTWEKRAKRIIHFMQEL